MKRAYEASDPDLQGNLGDELTDKKIGILEHNIKVLKDNYVPKEGISIVEKDGKLEAKPKK